MSCPQVPPRESNPTPEKDVSDDCHPYQVGIVFSSKFRMRFEISIAIREHESRR